MFGMCDSEMSLQEFAGREGGSMMEIDSMVWAEVEDENERAGREIGAD